ncbi:hypothetical protein BKA65DRAFT_553952 [Rhexocercosporidium sp. MPI-PUGE-AT-0058]|nr:hypothetical protein BKA65DRAFT_553952 [Rhexocercosporidium sp. MPI-PUGE-AT-0058]
MLLKADRLVIASAVASAVADSSLPMSDEDAVATILRVFPADPNYTAALPYGLPQLRDMHRRFERQVELYKALTGKMPPCGFAPDPPPMPASAPAPAKKIIIKLIVRRSPSPSPEPELVKKGKKSKARGGRTERGRGNGMGRGKSAARVAAAFPDPSVRRIVTRSQTRKLRLVAEQR